MLREIPQDVDIVSGGFVLPVAEGDVVLTWERLDSVEQGLCQRGHIRIRDRGFDRRGVNFFSTVGFGDVDGVFD